MARSTAAAAGARIERARPVRTIEKREVPDLDRLIHERIRLGIVSAADLEQALQD